MKFFKKTRNPDKDSIEKLATNTAWLLELNNVDELAALEATSKRLTKFSSDDTLSDIDLLQALSAIDKENRRRIERVTAKYTKFDNLRPELEAHIFDIAYGYYRQIYLVYYGLIDKFIATPDKHVFDYEWLHVLLGRAINASIGMIKWRGFKQVSAPANAWMQLSTMYKISVDEHLLTASLTLFDDEPSVTLQAMLTHAFLLGTLAQSNMNRQHIQITARLLKLWMPIAQIQQKFEAEKFLFYVDIDKDAGAKRIRALTPASSFRFLDVGQFNLNVEAAITGLEASQESPPMVPTEFTNQKILLETLQILRTEWSKSEYKRQRRRESRTKSAKSASICYGIEEVCKQVRHLANNNLANGTIVSAEGKSLDERLATHSQSLIKGAPNTYYMGASGERWLITDQSTRGLGARVGLESTTKAAQGKLIGVVMQDEKHQVIVGVIKAVKPLNNEQSRVSLEIIGTNAVWIRLTHIDKNKQDQNANYTTILGSPTESLLAFSGLYLPAQPGLSTHSSLLLPRIEFTQHDSYQVNILGMKKIVKLSKIVRGQTDWVQVA